MRTRRLFLVSLAAVAMLHVCYGLMRLQLGLDFTDEGAFVAWPLRMLFGENPFAGELGTLLRPLEAYLYLLFKVHPDITLYEFRLVGWAVHLLSFGLLSAWLFRLSHAPLRSPLVASVPFYVCSIFGLASPSYNSLSSDFLLMALALRGLSSSEESRWPRALNVASGFALFLATLAHTGLGLVGAALVLFELFRGGLVQNALRRRLTPSNVGVLTFIACWFVFVVYLLAIGALAVWFHRITLFQSFNVPSIETSPFRFYLQLLGYPFTFSRMAGLFSGLALAAAGVLCFSSRPPPNPRAALAAAALALLLLVSLIYGFSYDSNHLPIYFAQAALILLVVHGLGLTAPLLPALPPVRLLLLLSGLGALVYATVTFYFSYPRSWMSGILALPFAFATGLTLLLGVKPGRFTALFNLLATAMLALTVACVAREHYRFVYRDAPPQELSVEFSAPKLRHIRSTAERVRTIDALYDYLHPQLGRGEPLLAFDNCPMLYFIFDAMPAYNLAFAMRYTQSPGALQQLNRELLARPLPRYAIRNLVDLSQPVWSTARRISYENYPLNETVMANYVLERTIFPFEVWRLKPATPVAPPHE